MSDAHHERPDTVSAPAAVARQVGPAHCSDTCPSWGSCRTASPVGWRPTSRPRCRCGGRCWSRKGWRMRRWPRCRSVRALHRLCGAGCLRGLRHLAADDPGTQRHRVRGDGGDDHPAGRRHSACTSKARPVRGGAGAGRRSDLGHARAAANGLGLQLPIQGPCWAASSSALPSASSSTSRTSPWGCPRSTAPTSRC
jgi:hypothetical protein